MSKSQFKRRAFSLTELLVIMLIVLFVAVILSPVVVKARAGSDRGSKLLNESRLNSASAIYLVDYDQEFPTPEAPFKAVHFTTQNSEIPMASQMRYHGGPLILGTVNVYYIWYGNWSGNSAVTILTDLASNVGGSPYFNINTTYYNGSNVHVSNSVHYAGSTTDSYSRGTSLSDSAIQGVVSDAISSGRLPKDTNAVYFVLTSADVTANSGFCTQYCGWHTYGTISGSNIKYAFVGNPDRCPSACSAQSTGPNGNAGADGMASIIAHELEEATTDPNLNAWYTSRGYENADLCAWKFGSTYTVNGAQANMRLGARDFLIQQNWLNVGGGSCRLAYP